jgi:hypothetical protein
MRWALLVALVGNASAADVRPGHRLTLSDGRVLDGVWDPVAGRLDTSHLGFSSNLALDPRDVVSCAPTQLAVQSGKQADPARARRAAQAAMLATAEATIARLSPQAPAAQALLADMAAIRADVAATHDLAAREAAVLEARIAATPPAVRWTVVPAPMLQARHHHDWRANLGVPLGGWGHLSLTATSRTPCPPTPRATALVATTVPADTAALEVALAAARARRDAAANHLRRLVADQAQAERTLAGLAEATTARERWRRALGLAPMYVDL